MFERMIVVAAIAVVAACGSKEEKGSPAESKQPAAAAKPAKTPAAKPSAVEKAKEPAARDLTAAKEFFKTRCASCHGPAGAGDGPAAQAINPKPRNYTDKKWQAEVTDEALEEIILKGGPAVGKSNLMPPSPDLEDKPEMVRDLRILIRQFGGI